MRETGRPYRIVFVAEPVCWTEVPSSLAVLGKQRRRWSRGLAEILIKHRGMIGNPRYGRIGTVAMPYYLIFELISPFIELFGFAAVLVGFAVGAIDLTFAVLFLLVAVGYGIFLSVSALTIEEYSFHRYPSWRDLAIGFLAAILENVGYRQLHSWWRLRGVIAAVRNRPPEWGTMKREGLGG
jgi:cellulose synthase/poly-beta-1,6-N-acetylglucosamine synthase-like glycosyltransferase